MQENSKFIFLPNKKVSTYQQRTVNKITFYINSLIPTVSLVFQGLDSLDIILSNSLSSIKIFSLQISQVSRNNIDTTTIIDNFTMDYSSGSLLSYLISNSVISLNTIHIQGEKSISLKIPNRLYIKRFGILSENLHSSIYIYI